MSELAQKIGHGYSEKNEQADKVNTKRLDKNSEQNISLGKQAVRDITKEQWFWDTAVLS